MGKHLAILRNGKKAGVDIAWWAKGKATWDDISKGGRSQIIQSHVYYSGLDPEVNGKSLK